MPNLPVILIKKGSPDNLTIHLLLMGGRMVPERKGNARQPDQWLRIRLLMQEKNVQIVQSSIQVIGRRFLPIRLYF